MPRDTALSIDDCVNQVCPWSGRPVSAEGLLRYRGRVVGFRGPGSPRARRTR